uniref:Transposase n=1 Tax=Strongyloides venezuelensis TaxID=75913 RepID=A0A0K0FCW1_STRVS
MKSQQKLRIRFYIELMRSVDLVLMQTILSLQNQNQKARFEAGVIFVISSLMMFKRLLKDPSNQMPQKHATQLEGLQRKIEKPIVDLTIEYDVEIGDSKNVLTRIQH